MIICNYNEFSHRARSLVDSPTTQQRVRVEWALVCVYTWKAIEVRCLRRVNLVVALMFNGARLSDILRWRGMVSGSVVLCWMMGKLSSSQMRFRQNILECKWFFSLNQLWILQQATLDFVKSAFISRQTFPKKLKSVPSWFTDNWKLLRLVWILPMSQINSQTQHCAAKSTMN